MIVSTPCRLRTGTSVHRVGLVVELEVAVAAVTIDGVPSSVIPTIATLMPVEVVDRERREDRLARSPCRSRWRPGTGSPPPRSRHRRSTPRPDGNHRSAFGELGRPLVELVVADAVVVEADEVHGFDRGLVVEDGGTTAWRRSVAGRHEQRVRDSWPASADVAGQVLGTAGRGGADAPAGAGRVGRSQLAVEIVEGQDLDVSDVLVVLAGSTGRRVGPTMVVAAVTADGRTVDRVPSLTIRA